MFMLLERHPQNPLIRPQDVKPSRPDFEVIGAFNCAATLFGDETLLLLRVAERPQNIASGIVACPHLNEQGDLVVEEVSRQDERYDFGDTRYIVNPITGDLLLTSISH